MRLGGRTQAAIEILSDIKKRQRPTSEALKDWGLAHRFAGSGDRAAIGNLVYDVLRKRSSAAFIMDSDKPRKLVFATLMRDWGLTRENIEQEFLDDKFAPDALTDEEFQHYQSADLETAPLHIQADLPEWVTPSFEANFAEEWVIEAQALCQRPPLDLRVNTLKSNRDKITKALQRQQARPTKIATAGLRIAPIKGAKRLPNVTAEAGYQKGWFEIQDEGSQIVAELVGVQAGDQILDFCAGAGGKTLALSALMENKGQIHAYDVSKNRLKPIYQRIMRAGNRNVQVHDSLEALEPLVDKMDKVVIDAPCTGSGTWRRHPDAKWRFDKANLETRLTEQEEVLSQASIYVKAGGYLIYITCSVLPEENENQIYSFCEDNPEFELISCGEVWQERFGFDTLQPWSSDMKTITLTPASTGTDGFFFAVLERKG